MEGKKILASYVLIVIGICIISIGAYGILYQSYMNLENEYQRISNSLDNKIDVIDDINESISFLRQSLDENISELEKLQFGNRYETHDPTYLEAKTFMKQDKTDKIQSNEETFTCIDYSTEVNNNAEKQGIRCYVIYLQFEETAHSLISFNTTDKGMIYFEPQSDERVKYLKIGNDYWTDCVIPKKGYYYTNDPDDTIQRILIYW